MKPRYFLPIIWLSFIACLLVSCHHADVSGITLRSIDGDARMLQARQGERCMVFVFMSPDCPLCINYTQTLNRMREHFSSAKAGYYAIFPGTYYSKDEIRSFVLKYNFSFEPLLDPDYQLVNAVHATVTPEAIVMDPQGNTVYRGAIDDWSYETGKKKLEPESHFLEDALAAVFNGAHPAITETTATGCLIE